MDLIAWTREYFARKNLPSARLEAELLLAAVLRCDRVRLYVEHDRPVSEEALARFRELVRKRGEERIPTQQLLGRASFLELELRVTPAVFIPRPETEELALWGRKALAAMPGDSLSALDLGTGSGCLALALAAGEKRARVAAVDLSPAALSVARENAAALGLAERLEFLEGDLFAPLASERRGTFDLVVSNPPYLDAARKAALPPEVREHEPPEALFAEEQGAGVLRRIAGEAGAWLRPGGALGLEVSPELAGAVRGFLEADGAFGELEVRRDAQRLERFVLARKIAAPAEAMGKTP